MNALKPFFTLFIGCICFYQSVIAQTSTVNIYPQQRYSIGSIQEFDRSKYIVLHATQMEHDFIGSEKLMDYVINDLDVYLGRNNGIMGGVIHRSKENPKQTGFVDPNFMETAGKRFREVEYAKKWKHTHQYESHNFEMVGGQVQFFWTGHSTNINHPEKGWTISGPEAIGDFMGQFINEFYRDKGAPISDGPIRPEYVEVINEPLWELIDGVADLSERKEPKEIFEFHNKASQAFKKHNTEVKIGGYTAAFPFFDDADFEQWNSRMKLFYDMSGEYMDFVSIHLYDFNHHHLGDNDPTTFDGPINFTGGRIEATLDLMESYSMKKYGRVIPILISEYGGRDHATEGKPWYAERDWDYMKSMSPMMMQFMQRPDHIVKAIPFMIGKAEWGRKENPYPWRLLRQEFELEGKSKKWVFTEQIKFYELWSEVKGSKINITSQDPTLLVDAYKDGNHIYVALSNLTRAPKNVSLNLLDLPKESLLKVEGKQLTLKDHQPVLVNAQLGDTYQLDSEGTAIITYTLKEEITSLVNIKETKHYSDLILQEIQASKATTYTFDKLNTTNLSSAKIRIGYSRPHGQKVFPTVSVNGKEVQVPQQLMGLSQHLRPQLFTSIEVDVPKEYLLESNTVEITFPDEGGHISSVILKELTKNNISE
ncbi:hypothetical protein [Flammeovirga sp. SubArs3]|uniref:hypothetical protein n=1 Tax=Flammeovirga sp. SubArs3 TaxID=2995316 RepID=UPI00248C81B9|nr:hypothetical protein [Flammeovirga sp. SubArs3]